MIRLWFMRLAAAELLLGTPLTAAAQSQAVNGSISGQVLAVNAGEPAG